MADIQFNASSLLASGSQTYGLSSLISISASQTPAAVIAIRVYDRDNYAGPQSFDYGHFSSPLGGQISAGTQYRLTTLYFDYKNGQYVSRDTGETLASYNFKPSDQNYRSVYLSLFSSDSQGATYDSAWLDPSWNHLSDLNVVTRTDYVDLTPNSATPQEIAALAKSFIGKVWNDHGCWLLTSNIAAGAGASLPAASAKLDTADITGNGQWQVVFNAAQQTGDWRALLQTGDIVELGFYGGTAHIATVTSGSGHNAMWVDNSGASANDGTAGDIIIQGEHSVDQATSSAIESTVIIFRLAQASAAPSSVPAPIAPPVVTAHSQSMQIGQSLSVASLFSVQDPNLLPMSSYQIIDQGGSAHIQLNGAANLATPAQQQAGTVIVAAADLAKLTYVATLGPDTLTITAFNGQAWGSAKATLTGWVDPPPTVAGSTQSLHATSQLLPAASLFTAAAAAGHAITEYRFIDTDHTGQLVVVDKTANIATNEEAALGIYRVTAANLGSVDWKVLDTTGTLSVSAFDGVQWSDYAAITIAGLNTGPVVTALARTTLAVGQPVSLANLFSLSDAEGDAVKLVSIYDYYENVQLNGAVDHCPEPHTYQVTLADLSKLTYTAPTVMGGLQGVSAYAYDGTTWGKPTTVSFTIADPHPVVEPTAATELSLNQSVPLSTLFIAVDPNNKTLTQYQVTDPAGAGSIRLNGASNLASAEQQAQGIAIFPAADLAKVSYVAGSQVGSEALTVSAYNGTLWGSVSVAVYCTDASSPVVRAAPATLDVGQTAALTDLCWAGSTSGKPITEYLIHDPAGAGALLMNGAVDIGTTAQKLQGVVVSAADFAKLQYLAAGSAASEVMSISAYDGTSWGQADLQVASKNFNRPVVTTLPITVHAGQSVSLQDLFRVSDANGNPIQYYQIDDTGHHLQLNSATNLYASQQYLGFYGIDARDLGRVVYVAGKPGTDTIYVEATDYQNSSMMIAETITVLPNPVITPTTVTLAIHQTVPLSSFFTADNPSGKPISHYKIADPGGAGTVYLNGAANLASASEQAQGIAVVASNDLAKLSYKGASSFVTETLLVSAYDSDSWGSSEVPVTTIDGAAPLVSAPATSVEVDSTTAVDSLFSAVSRSGQPITQYKIVDPLGGGKLVLNGAANSATPAQQAQEGMAIIASADLSKLQYVGADVAGSETLAISAYDGQSWGSVDLPIASLKSAPPVVTPATAFLDPGQSVKLTSLFGVADANGQAVSYYIFQDPDNSIQLNGATNLWAAQQSSGYYWINAKDISLVSYVPSRDGVFHFNIIVNDGFNYSSWTAGTAVVGRDRLSLPPAITPVETTVPLAQAVHLSGLFSVQDPIGNAISRYRVADPAGGGSVLLNGATDLATTAEHAAGLVVFAAADLARVRYQGAGTGGVEALTISAYDGLSWGSADIAVTSAILPPLVTAATTVVELDHTLKLSDIFAVSASSARAISQYKIQDPAGGGAVSLNGATNLADSAQRAQGISIVSAQDLPKLSYSAGSSAGSETLLISATDGQTWGASNIAVATADNRAPLLSQTASAVDVNETVWLSNFFAGSSLSGKPIVEYLIQDPAGGGQVKLNTAQDLASAAQKSQGIMVVAAYDLGAVLYTGGSTPGAETLAITAYDGQTSTNAAVNIQSVAAVPPVVTPKSVTMHTGDSVSLSDLLSVADANGFSIQHYVITDPALGIQLNGAANGFTSPTWEYQGHYYFSAADWGKVQYLAQKPGTVRVGVQVDDGHNISAYIEENITIVSGAGNETIGGSAGTDTVVFSGPANQYQVSQHGGVVLVTGPKGTDALQDVERLHFNDVYVAFDTSGDAGQAYRLYQAAFNRKPDLGGLGYWITAMDHGAPLATVAQSFIESPEFVATYGALGTSDFVAQMYLNVLHRPGEPSGALWWQQQIDSGAWTRSNAIVGFSESGENQAALIGVIQNGMTYTV